MIIEEIVRVGREHGEQGAPILALGRMEEPIAGRADRRGMSCLGTMAERGRRHHVEDERMLDRPWAAADRRRISIGARQRDQAARVTGGRGDFRGDRRDRQSLGIGDVEDTPTRKAGRKADQGGDIGD